MRSTPGRQRRPRSPSPGDRSGLAATKRVRLTRPVPATALVTPPSAPAAALLPGLVAPASQSLPLTPLAVAPARAGGAYERFDELGWLRGLLGRLHHHAAASPLPRLPVASAPGHPGRPELPMPGTCVSPRASSTSAWGDGHEAVPPVNALPAHVARNSQPSQVPVPSPDADPGGHQRAAWLSPAPAATPLPSPRARPHPTDTPDHMSGADPSAPYRLGQTAVLRPHQPGPVQAPNERRAPPRRQSAAVQAVCPITFETQSPSLEQCTDRRHPETQVKMNMLRDSARPCEPPRRTVEHDHNHKHKHKYEREPHIAAPAVTVENEQARPNAAERRAESGRTAAKARCLATAEHESQDRSRQAGDERLGHAACRAQDATTLAEQGRCMAAGRSVERCRLPHEQHSLPASAAKQDHVLEQHRVIEAERMAKAERQAAAEAREAEQLRQADEAHSAEEARQVEEARQAVEARLARLANEAHMAVEARLADARRKAEQHRLIEATCPPHDPAVADREPATEKQVRLDDTEQATNESGQSGNTCMAQADRVAEQLRLLGQLRRAVDRRLAAEHERSTEAKRLAKAKREASEQHRFKVERQALAKRHAEREHSAEQARLAEHLNESQRQAKETIQAEGAQPAEKARPADEARLAKETGMIEEGTLPELPRLSKQAQLPEQTDMVVPQSRLIEKVCPPEANFLSKDTCRAEETQEGPPDLEEDCLNEKKLVDQQQHLTADQSHFASAELFTEEARLASKMWLAEQVRLPNTKHSGDQEYSLETERMPDVTQPDELPCIGLEARSVEAGCSASQKYLAEQVQSSEQRRLPGDGENLTAQERLNQHDGLIDSAPITFSWSDLCIDTSLDGQSGETCPTVHLEEDFASDARRDDNDIAKVGRRVQGLQLDARTGLGTSSDHDKVSSPAPSSSYAPSEAPVQRKTPKQAAGHGGSRPVTRSQCPYHVVQLPAGHGPRTFLLPKCTLDASTLEYEGAQDCGPASGDERARQIDLANFQLPTLTQQVLSRVVNDPTIVHELYILPEHDGRDRPGIAGRAESDFEDISNTELSPAAASDPTSSHIAQHARVGSRHSVTALHPESPSSGVDARFASPNSACASSTGSPSGPQSIASITRAARGRRGRGRGSRKRRVTPQTQNLLSTQEGQGWTATSIITPYPRRRARIIAETAKTPSSNPAAELESSSCPDNVLQPKSEGGKPGPGDATSDSG